MHIPTYDTISSINITHIEEWINMTYLLYEILVGFFSNFLIIIPAIICFIAIKKGKSGKIPFTIALILSIIQAIGAIHNLNNASDVTNSIIIGLGFNIVIILITIIIYTNNKSKKTHNRIGSDKEITEYYSESDKKQSSKTKKGASTKQDEKYYDKSEEYTDQKMTTDTERKPIKSYCPNCGTKLTGNEKFCTNCGERLV